MIMLGIIEKIKKFNKNLIEPQNQSMLLLYSNSFRILSFMLVISILLGVLGVYTLHKYQNYTLQQLQFSQFHDDKYFYKILEVEKIPINQKIKSYEIFGLYFVGNYNLLIKNNNDNGLLLNIYDLCKFMLIFYLISLISLTSVFIFFLILSLNRERSIALKSLAGNEAILTNKSFILITENIHHELNTPLEVIDNKLEKIHSVISEYVSRKNPQHNKRDIDIKLNSLEEDFHFIKQSSEQIYSVLEKTRGFKHLRYSNGNKSIYDIVEGAFKIMSISNSNFKYQIDPKLKKYKLNYSIVKDFKNADLLNIVLNHIKNSLEANSNKIHIIFNNYNKKLLSFSIIDNGNGVKENLKKHIFSPNFSTKAEYDNVIRGNGLYLNKSILNGSQGDVILLDSTQYGATFQIKISVIPND